MSLKIRSQEVIDFILLLFIVAVGGLLRFHDFPNIPMSHDELSAFYRLNFSSLKELIEYGVKEDGHPAGVQVFLFYWSRIFGTGDMIIKLPFLLLGMGSIVLAYRLAKSWFNSTPALLIAACMASLQFPLMYSQIARPYVFGLFFCLLMLIFWTRLVFGNRGRSIPVLIGFVLSASVCSYTHHFSLLFMAMVSATGLIFLRKENAIHYFLALLAVFVLYIPHLDIFFHQLKIGGLGWLGVPPDTFLIDYVKYIFHFSPLLYVAISVLFLIGVFTARHRLWPLSKYQLISIVWFIIPPVIGFLYSRFISPVVQYSVLIFSFPFLLFFVFSFYKPLSPGLKVGAVVLVLVLNISTLVGSRQHYEVFYKQPFREYAVLTRDFLDRHEGDDVTIVFQENPGYLNHYFSQLNPGVDYVSLYEKELTISEFRSIITANDNKYLITGSLPLEYISLVREYYPNLLLKDFGYTYEYYIFSRKQAGPDEVLTYDPVFSEHMDFEGAGEIWKISMCAEADSVNNGICLLDSVTVWGPKFEYSLTDITASRHDILDIALDYKVGKQGQIVCEIWKDNELLLWRGSKLYDFYDATRNMDWQTAYFSFRLSSLFKRDRDMRDCTLKVYYWNNTGNNILLDNFNIQAREGNPRIYALVEKI